MILTLVSLGKYFEGLSKKKTTNAISKLMDLSPKKAIVLIDNKEKEVDIKEVKVGDIIIQHNSKTGRAYHAVIIVGIKDGKYYVNHAAKSGYLKNVELKTRSNLSFYEYIPR